MDRADVAQSDLEAADGCAGKYTAGLGQEALAFCGDREDVVSMAATAALRCLEAARVRPADVGRIEVGTETGVDRSKSVASFLAAHFEGGGNTSLAVSDHTHGCYGGVSALLAAADWVAGPSWDGRLALVVATDIAVYPPGSPARPTGGGGAAALLVGPGAALVLEPWPARAHFAAHAYDFFKPHGHPLYPVVDGPATLLWFTRAADACAASLARQLAAAPGGDAAGGAPRGCLQLLRRFDHFISHAPYGKLVRKVFARLVLHDMLRAQQEQQQQPQQQPQQQQEQQQEQEQQQQQEQQLQQLQQQQQEQQEQQEQEQQQQQQQQQEQQQTLARCRDRPPLPPLPAAAAGLDPDALGDGSIADKALERALLEASGPLFQAMASQGAALQRQLGNLYTASLFSGLAGLLAAEGAGLAGRRLLCFSFGSGVAAAMFVLRGRDVQDGPPAQPPSQPQHPRAAAAAAWRGHPCSLQHMADALRVPQRLAGRLRRSGAEFDAAMASLRSAYGAAPLAPGFGDVADLEPGTVHLVGVDGRFRRTYARTPAAGG
ncbi:HMGCS-2 [Scenedesmus sp. PABB004]|nr:HMGCS-2 [Scenedesmus sp. PABB004]